MDYKSAYFMLFNHITNLILELEALQVKAEEIVVCGDEPTIRILEPMHPTESPE